LNALVYFFSEPDMAEILKERIIRLLKQADYTPVKAGQLARALGVSSEDYPQFKLAFEELRRAGHVVVGGGSLVGLPPMSGQVTGTFRGSVKGFGFVTPLEPNSHGDLFIPPGKTGQAMTGDTVAAQVVREGGRAGQMRFSGRVIEVLERAENRFVGTLSKEAEGWIVQPDGSRFLEPIGVDDVTAKGARPKDKVVVEILSYPTEKYLARGVIVEVLGRSGQYETEIRSIVCQYHLPDEFDAECQVEAREAAGQFRADALEGREDITAKVVITIDPPDAKDFDDAISLEKDGEDNWVLGVHIADVSSFVPEDSLLDSEARERGNSVYLPGKTIPMLPEILSNGVCSLQSGQERFAKSAYITYDKQGNVLSRRFANSVICSTQRLTYQQADKALRGRAKDVKAEVVRLLKDMELLSRVIEKRRIKNGMLHLDLPETELVLDKSGRVVDAHPADDSYPHTMIEMFMVEANEAVASLLDRLNLAFIRRIHPEPDVMSLKNLAQLVRGFGYNLPRNPDRSAIQDLLDGVKGADCSLAVNLAVLRSFEKAQYAPLHVGHFALASTHYCHFTSPIRRYADLMVHRLLEGDLRNGSCPRGAEQDLVEIGKHITFTEERADDAERELTAVLILQMLSSHIGDELDCVVTGLTNFGVFVRCRKYGIEGLVRTGDLGPDEWKFEPKSHCITGVRTGYTIRLGQAMKVRIVSVNVPARQLNVVPVEPLTGKAARTTATRKPKKGEKERTVKRTGGKGRSRKR